MRKLFVFAVCILALCGCSNNRTSSVAVEDCRNEKFDSFLTQFAQYDGVRLDESFFRVREQFPTEIYSPCIDKYYFSFLLPYDDECNCEANELYYRPCYRIEQKNYYLISMIVCCDVPKTECYPYDDNTLATYDKKGKMIDFVTVGTASDFENYKINSMTGEYEITFTQYRFDDEASSGHSGKCNVSSYRVVVDSDGKITKRLLGEEKNVNVVL